MNKIKQSNHLYYIHWVKYYVSNEKDEMYQKRNYGHRKYVSDACVKKIILLNNKFKVCKGRILVYSHSLTRNTYDIK